MKPHSIPTDRNTLLQLPKEQLVDMVLELIERLPPRTDSQISSKPPSSDLLTKPEQPPAPATEPEAKPEPKRQPGGQPGHQGTTRKGFSRVDRYESLEPQSCSHCGSLNLLRSAHQSRQVACLVERPVEIVEYQRYRCQCQECGQQEEPEWPQHLIAGQDMDARLQALLGWLGHRVHLSYEAQQELLEEWTGQQWSVGTLVKVKERVAAAIMPSVQAAWQQMRQEAVVYVDETPWPVKGLKEWLWHVGTETVSLFHGGDSRSRAELESLLGKEFGGCLVSDDYSVYNGYRTARQQKCLAHLRRQCKRLERLGKGVQAEIGKVMKGLIDEAFAQYQSYQQSRDGPQFQQWGEGFRQRVEEAIKHWQPQAGYEAGKLLRTLREKAEQWWHFLKEPEVRPDNNLSERALRLGVTKRKVSGGSRSLEGLRDTADLLSVVQSCRRQGRSVMEFFYQALQARCHSDCEQPSLFPTFQT